MANEFYTCGGSHFWEDVFFYQKWRIQRNYTSKKCRLLDNWDICRFEGSFEECRKAFIKYIEVYELARQKGHMIIMLPGLGESKNVFKPLWREAIKEGFMAAAINYPSTQKGIEGHVRQLDFFLNHLEDVEEVSFVTHGAGSIILKSLMSKASPWKQKLKIGRIVDVQPLYHGSRLLVKLSRNKLLGFILGPMAKEMEPRRIESIPQLQQDIECGIVKSESWLVKLIEMVTRTKSPRFSDDEELKFSGASDIINIANHKMNIFHNTEVVKAVMKFLTTGSF